MHRIASGHAFIRGHTGQKMVCSLKFKSSAPCIGMARLACKWRGQQKSKRHQPVPSSFALSRHITLRRSGLKEYFALVDSSILS